MSTMDTNLIRRIAVAVVAIPLAIALTWYGSWPFVILVAVVTVLGTRELLALAGHAQVEGSRSLQALRPARCRCSATPSCPTTPSCWCGRLRGATSLRSG